ncbi:hypothetical protein STTU_5221 [Streptomyces sp. Tu6071]|nr:hypothetical protein STTU_5221 [Streptomyces sp. Tu6071]
MTGRRALPQSERFGRCGEDPVDRFEGEGTRGREVRERSPGAVDGLRGLPARVLGGESAAAAAACSPSSRYVPGGVSAAGPGRLPPARRGRPVRRRPGHGTQSAAASLPNGPLSQVPRGPPLSSWRPHPGSRHRHRSGHDEGGDPPEGVAAFFLLALARNAGGSVEGVAAGAGAGRVRVVDREALLLDRVHEVDRGAAEVRGAHAVGDDLDAAELLDDVAVERALVEEELVAQAGAAAGLDGHAQREVVTAFLVQQGLDLRRGGVGQEDALAHGGGLVRYGHLLLSRVVRRLLADVPTGTVGELFPRGHGPRSLIVAYATGTGQGPRRGTHHIGPHSVVNLTVSGYHR